MKSFPSSLNRGNKNIIMNHASKSLLDTIVSSFKNAFVNAWKAGMKAGKYGVKPNGTPVDIEGLQFDDKIDKKILLKGLNFTKFRDYRGETILRGSSMIDVIKIGTDEKTPITIENPYNFDSNAIAIMNKYKGETLSYVTNVSNIPSAQGYLFGSRSDAKRSLFNPYNSVHVIGMTENVPLLYDQKESANNVANDRETNLSDCSISRLVRESAKKQSILGQARYKYADFAFCKDLGMPNNRLITLRKFSTPVGDYIFKAATVKASKEDNKPFVTPGDIGRLCCYFDTDDNKLEDILKYSFSGSWKHMDASLQQLDSQEDKNVSPLGQIINALNPSMNASIGAGFSSADNSLIGKAFKTWFGWDTSANYDKQLLKPQQWDEHRIFTPINTVQSMEKYEGKLEFKHEFTLVFSYKLRSYQNINPKSAMLDLIANILATTYNRGNFWGGRNEIVGAQPNKSGWNKALALCDKTTDFIGGIIGALANNTFNMGSILGSFANGLGNLYNGIGQKVADMGPKEAAKAALGSADYYIKKYGINGAVKGLLQNQLGRPEIYAFQTLLDGSNTGFWHVTIGNPLNPIASIGNLIIKDTQIQHLGPLGIDDFPTELKVTVTLAHARPRDAVAIERMYTKGVGAIYIPLTAYGKKENTFKTDVKEEVGSLDYFGEFEPERIARNAEELD